MRCRQNGGPLFQASILPNAADASDAPTAEFGAKDNSFSQSISKKGKRSALQHERLTRKSHIWSAMLVEDRPRQAAAAPFQCVRSQIMGWGDGTEPSYQRCNQIQNFTQSLLVFIKKSIM
mmetsp:Transcript_25109/g.42785  ORF Transcript_25109/g.42785 Transcript_25109/m.42785 type:complete len:120 (+) Transcript_25109:494-853(+)